MRVPSFLKDRTLLLLLAPLLAVVAVLGAGRLDSDTPTERRAARAATTTTEPGADDAGAPPPAEVAAEVAAAEGAADLAVDGSGSYDGGSYDGGSYDSGSVDPGAAQVLVDAIADDGPSTTTPTGGASSTTAPLPEARVVEALAEVTLRCTAAYLDAPDEVLSEFTSPAVIAAATFDKVRPGTPLAYAVAMIGPANSLGTAGPGTLAHQVAVQLTGGTPSEDVRDTLNGLDHPAGGFFLVPDTEPYALVGELPVSAAAGTGLQISFTRIQTDHPIGARTARQRCEGVSGPIPLLKSTVVDATTTPTTVPLPTPVVDESPIAALIPASALVVAGLGLVVVVRRRRIAPDGTRA